MRLVSLMMALSLVVLSGCGFALRGVSQPLAERFSYAYVAHAESTPDRLVESVGDRLELSGGHIVKRAQARVIVNLSGLETQSRQVAISADGDTQEYERTYSVVVTVLDVQTGAQLGQRNVRSIQNLQQNNQRVLASDEQASITRGDAEDELVEEIILYLRTFK